MYLRRLVTPQSSEVFVAKSGSPALSGYEFAAGFQAKFSDPVPPPAFTIGGFGVHVAPTNDHVIVVGARVGSLLTYEIDGGSLINGVEWPLPDPPNVPYGIGFDEPGTAIVIAGDQSIAEYDYAGTTPGALRWTFDNENNGAFVKAVLTDRYCYALRNDSVDVQSLGGVEVFDRTSGANLSSFPNELLIAALTMSVASQPLDNGRDVIAFTIGSQLNLLQVDNGIIQAQQIAHNLTDVRYAGFVTRRRLVVNRVGNLEVYQMEGDGDLVLINSIPYEQFDQVLSMQFDVISDIVFTGGILSPFIKAYPLTDDGLGAPFDDPAVPLSSVIRSMSVRYPSGWTNFQV